MSKKDRTQYGTRLTPALQLAVKKAAMERCTPGKSVSQADIIEQAVLAYLSDEPHSRCDAEMIETIDLDSKIHAALLPWLRWFAGDRVSYVKADIRRRMGKLVPSSMEAKYLTKLIERIGGAA